MTTRASVLFDDRSKPRNCGAWKSVASGGRFADFLFDLRERRTANENVPVRKFVVHASCFDSAVLTK
jgi:hypothetical protein